MKKPPRTEGGKDSGQAERSLGDALRDAYEDTVKEAVPDDLLDLLKKLD